MPSKFELISEYQPAGDQPQAIEQLVRGYRSGQDRQILMGVTGSGKTFTAAHVIAQLNRPTLVLSHNKTLAAQLSKHQFETHAQVQTHKNNGPTAKGKFCARPFTSTPLP